jgi:hypothetical protein
LFSSCLPSASEDCFPRRAVVSRKVDFLRLGIAPHLASVPPSRGDDVTRTTFHVATTWHTRDPFHRMDGTYRVIRRNLAPRRVAHPAVYRHVARHHHFPIEWICTSKEHQSRNPSSSYPCKDACVATYRPIPSLPVLAIAYSVHTSGSCTGQKWRGGPSGTL